MRREEESGHKDHRLSVKWQLSRCSVSIHTERVVSLRLKKERISLLILFQVLMGVLQPWRIKTTRFTNKSTAENKITDLNENS